MRVNKCEERVVKCVNDEDGFLIIIEVMTRISQKEEMRIREGGKEIKIWIEENC